MRSFIIKIMINKYSNQPPQEQKGRPDSRTMLLSHLPNIVNAAGAQACVQRKVQDAAPSAPSAFVADPSDLVARALAILAEEAEAWQARRVTNASPGRTR
jgi:hypothetical protein